jgi:hypothetical protein
MTEKREPLQLGTKLAWGETTCGFGLTEPECDKPATRHFMWLIDRSTSPACDEHAALVHARDTTATPFDEHAHGSDCGMPGSHWRFPYEDEDEGYCFFPAVDDASLLMEKPEPVLVAATKPTEYEEQS